MYENEVISLIKSGVGFMGTVEDNRPHVRPMRPYIDNEGHIWLFSRYDSRKVAELDQNPRVELCFVGPESEVLTIYGRISNETKHSNPVYRVVRDLMFAEIPEMKEYFSENDETSVTIYRFIVHEIRYMRANKELTTRVNLPMAQDPDIELAMCQGGFCLNS
jgi:general stress protein 26